MPIIPTLGNTSPVPRGEFIPRLANATTPGLVKMLADPGVAPADTALRGDDWRLSREQVGVAFNRGCCIGVAPQPIEEGPGEGNEFRGFSYVLRLRLLDGLMGETRYIVSGGSGDGFHMWYDPGVRSLSAGRPDGTESIMVTDPAAFEYGEEMTLVYSWVRGAASLYKNGARIAFNNEYFPNFGVLILGHESPAYSFRGEVREFRVFNRALSLEEIAGLNYRRIPADLTHRAVIGLRATVSNGRFGFVAATDFYDMGEGSFQGVFGPYSGATFAIPVAPRAGQRVQIIFTVNNFNGDAPGTAYLFSNEWPYEIDNNSINFSASGTYVYETTIGAQLSTQGCLFAIMNAGAGGTWVGTVVLLNVTYFGAVASYLPDTLLASGRWLDASGNGYDLVPRGEVTPLAPPPAGRRSDFVRYDMAAVAYLQASGRTRAVKAGLGVLDIQWPPWVTEEMMPGVTVTCSDAASGGTFIAPLVHVSHDLATLGRMHRVYMRRADTRALTDYGNVEVILSWTE